MADLASQAASMILDSVAAPAEGAAQAGGIQKAWAGARDVLKGASNQRRLQEQASNKADQVIRRQTRELRNMIEIMGSNSKEVTKVLKQHGMDPDKFFKQAKEIAKMGEADPSKMSKSQRMEVLAQQEGFTKVLSQISKSDASLALDPLKNMQRFEEVFASAKTSDDAKNQAFSDMNTFLEKMGKTPLADPDVRFTDMTEKEQKVMAEAMAGLKKSLQGSKPLRLTFAELHSTFDTISTNNEQLLNRLSQDTGLGKSVASSFVQGSVKTGLVEDLMGTALGATGLGDVFSLSKEVGQSLGIGSLTGFAHEKITGMMDLKKSLGEQAEQEEAKEVEKDREQAQKKIKDSTEVAEDTNKVINSVQETNETIQKEGMPIHEDSIEEIGDEVGESTKSKGGLFGGKGLAGALFNMIKSPIFLGIMGTAIAAVFTAKKLSELAKELALFSDDKKTRDKIAEQAKAATKQRRKLAELQTQDITGTKIRVKRGRADETIFTDGSYAPSVTGIAGYMANRFADMTGQKKEVDMDLAKYLAAHPETKKRMLAQGGLIQNRDGALSLGKNAADFGIIIPQSGISGASSDSGVQTDPSLSSTSVPGGSSEEVMAEAVQQMHKFTASAGGGGGGAVATTPQGAGTGKQMSNDVGEAQMGVMQFID